MTDSRYRKFFEIAETRSTLIDPREGTEVQLTDIERPIDWGLLFGNENPVEIEVGCGNGKFLIEVSKRYPDINYVGVERSRKYLLRTKEHFNKHLAHLPKAHPLNVRLVWSDAAYFIDRYVADASVKAYHVYFPDPWPKKRHHKRRLFRNGMWLRGLIRTLYPDGGRICIATDHEEYFNEIRQRIDTQPHFAYLPPERIGIEHIPTNFELKYRAEGRKIYRAAYHTVCRFKCDYLRYT